jgi:hypothetical protein
VEMVATVLPGTLVHVDAGPGKTHCQGHPRPALGYLRVQG